MKRRTIFPQSDAERLGSLTIMSVYESSVQTGFGLRSAIPVFQVLNLGVAARFYEQLGFEVRRYDTAYAYATREKLTIHLQASPDGGAPSAQSEVFVETTAVDELHAEWRELDLMEIRTIITPDMRAELRRRMAAGNPMGLISYRVKDQPWGVREFIVRDVDNNKLRFGRTRTRASSPGFAA